MAEGKVPCHKIWESETHLAFLSIFPNTPGFTVVIPKAHQDSYAFGVEDHVLTDLILATKQVAQILTHYFKDAPRCGMFFEGYGIDHLHSKLFPMHGAGEFEKGKSIEVAKPTVFFERYPGYLSSHDAGRANDGELAELAAKIRAQQF
jgi:diadenosine tetraphosphate (Ap4A) HIT family hydrolase